MTISVSILTSGADLAPAGVASSTASISPAADRPIHAWVLSDRAAGALAAPTVSGNGITWTQVATVTYNTTGTPLSRLTVFRGSAGAPTTGAITFTHSATPTSVVWQITETSAATNSAASATIQSASGSVNAGTTVTATLAAFQRPQNGAIAASAVVSGITPTAGSGWTDLGTQSTRLQLEWRADNDTTADSTFLASNAAIIAIEVAAATTLSTYVPETQYSELVHAKVSSTFFDGTYAELVRDKVSSTFFDGTYSELVRARQLFGVYVDPPYSELTKNTFFVFASTSTSTDTYSLNVDTPLSYSSASTSTDAYALVYVIDVAYSSTSISSDIYALTVNLSLGPYSPTSTSTDAYTIVAAVPVDISFLSSSDGSTNYVLFVEAPAPSPTSGSFRRFLNLGPRVKPPPGSTKKNLT